jgi:hypothetical protein
LQQNHQPTTNHLTDLFQQSLQLQHQAHVDRSSNMPHYGRPPSRHAHTPEYTLPNVPSPNSDSSTMLASRVYEVSCMRRRACSISSAAASNMPRPPQCTHHDIVSEKSLFADDLDGLNALPPHHTLALTFICNIHQASTGSIQASNRLIPAHKVDANSLVQRTACCVHPMLCGWHVARLHTKPRPTHESVTHVL